MNYDKIIDIVYQASKIMFSKQLKATVKDGNPNDFVTVADTAISDFVKEKLKEEFPSVGFVTEEEPKHAYLDKTFILDPIDGTTNLIYDYKMSSVSLVYQEKGVVKFGVVFNPFTYELFFGVKGKGAYLYVAKDGIEELLKIGVENYKENRLKTSDRPIAQSIIECGLVVSDKTQVEDSFARAKRVFINCLDLRRTCSTALAICYIASGRLDGYFEKKIKPWDYAAGILILEEAGGKSCDWEGNPLPLDRNGSILCSNSVIIDDLKKLVVG